MGKYVFELLHNSSAQQELVWVLFGNNPSLGMAAPERKTITTDIFEFKGDRFTLWEQMVVPLRAIRHNVDVLHFTEGSL